jgi:Tol biopolymer transport system component
MKLRRFTIALMLLVAAALFVGCGGRIGSVVQPPPPGNVTATCVPYIQIGVVSATYTCTANEAVDWSVDNSALATISSAGVLTPNATTTGTVTVTGTPTGTDKSGTATVNVVDQIIYGGTYLVNSDGSDPIKLTTGCYNSEWFADHLSFACTGVTGNNLLVYKTNGTAAGTTLSATLTWPNLGQPDVASPSPNGKTLVFRAYDETVNKFGVYQANVDGTNLQLLSQEAACTGGCVGIGQPRYSYNDGKKIVYTHVVQGQSMVCTMNVDKTDQSCLVAGGDGAFSTDGTEIFLTTADGVHSIGSNGGQLSALIFAGCGGAMSSPNGKKLVCGTAAGISTSYIDGSGQKALVAGGGHGSW